MNYFDNAKKFIGDVMSYISELFSSTFASLFGNNILPLEDENSTRETHDPNRPENESFEVLSTKDLGDLDDLD